MGRKQSQNFRIRDFLERQLAALGWTYTVLGGVRRGSPERLECWVLSQTPKGARVDTLPKAIHVGVGTFPFNCKEDCSVKAVAVTGYCCLH